jgi:hypothetical protein
MEAAPRTPLLTVRTTAVQHKGISTSLLVPFTFAHHHDQEEIQEEATASYLELRSQN